MMFLSNRILAVIEVDAYFLYKLSTVEDNGLVESRTVPSIL